MHRTLLAISLVLPACFVQQIEDIIANHDVSSDATSSGGLDTSTVAGSTTDFSESDTSSTTAGETTTSSTGGAEAGMDASGDTISSTSTDVSSSSTGPTPPVCGDGVIDSDETCDDMNDDPDDGCKHCTLDRLVFATSERYQGFTLEGLFGADQRCRMLAAVANLPNSGTYRAWLSDSNTSAADRITHSKGRYTLVNGIVVAADWDALISGLLESPIDTTEDSEASDGSCAWTGTFANGLPAFGSTFCDNWSSSGGRQDGGRGSGDFIDDWWSFIDYSPCGSECALYCFEN
jgi:cysteine-rich repeat protein